MRQSPEWNEILEINSRSHGIWSLTEKERIREEKVIVAEALAWIKRNPNLVLDMLNLSMGKIDDWYLRYSYSPLLLEAIGLSGHTEVIAPIEKVLRSCRWKICLDSKPLMKALMLLNTPESNRVLAKLVKKSIFRKRNYLISDFVYFMDENPNPIFLPLLLDLIRKTNVWYKVEYILSRLIDANAISYEELLDDKSNRVRKITVDALRFADTRYLTEPVIEKLSEIIHNTREDIHYRSNAADILKKLDIEVPRRFRDIKEKNESSNLERFVKGILFLERPEDWAMMEVTKITYRGDMYRTKLTCGLGNVTFARIRIWRGQFWDEFAMGFSLRKKLWPRNTYIVSGICRSILFRTGALREEFLIEQLDRLLIIQANRIARESSNNYAETISKANELFSQGYTINERMWIYDKDRIKAN